MGERLSPQSPERQSTPEVDVDSAEQSKKNIERVKQLAEQEKETNEEQIEALREQVESTAETREHTPLNSQETKSPPAYHQGDLKREGYKKTMKNVRSRLSPTQRAFSKVVHQKSVETISNAAGKTIARPSGVLGGGLIALAGSITVLYFAKHYGFQYNYTLFILLYAAGFVGGLLFEVLVRAKKRRG
ncbi:MAG: hypothetical protein U5L95_01535 [Candidatus Saccharibacteria bacterium]|nr:hypothetical protein [Candidatus Saccharibacteria bacterium]